MATAKFNYHSGLKSDLHIQKVMKSQGDVLCFFISIVLYTFNLCRKVKLSTSCKGVLLRSREKNSQKEAKRIVVR